jgi:hypothetical protein
MSLSLIALHYESTAPVSRPQIAAGGGGLRRLHGQFTITASTGGCAAICYDI